MKLLTRHPDWEPRLAACVADWTAREYSFAWGCDCVAFVLVGIEAVADERLIFDGVQPYRSPAGQGRWLKGMGWGSLLDAADATLGLRIAPLQTHRGDVISDGSVLGLMTAAGPMVFSEDGIVVIERGSIVAAWPVGRSDG
jgi:hypothetical protein